MPLEISEDVPEVLPDIWKADKTVWDDCAVCEYETVPPVVLSPRPPPAAYIGPKIETTLLVVLAVPVVVLCDNPSIETAWRYRVPLWMSEDVPDVLPEIWTPEIRFVPLAAGAGTEIVTLPAPTPTLAIPAPEKFSKLEKVPVELETVLPSAVREIEDVWTIPLIETVMLPAPVAV